VAASTSSRTMPASSCTVYAVSNNCSDCVINSVTKDLVYADFLIQAGLAKQVRVHGKRFP
jgi:hypothetical protein